jgi:hypothetical protein
MLSDLRVRLRALFRRGAVEADLAEELRLHLDLQTDKYVRAGMSPEEAVRLARVELGGLEQVKEECRSARGVSLIETLAQDLRYAGRQLPGTILRCLRLAHPQADCSSQVMMSPTRVQWLSSATAIGRPG